MQVWQRGTSVTTSGAYTADRWAEVSGNSNQHIQSTDAPTNFGYSMQIIGVGGNINQRIESLNCQDLSGQTITISFWVKNTSGTDSLIVGLYYCNSADNFGSLTQIGSNVTISSNPSSTWTQYTVTFSNLPAGAKNGLSLYIARLGTGSVSTTWYLTGVQLEVGVTATRFDTRPYTTELQLAQRYFWSSGAGITATVSSFAIHGSGAVFDTDSSDIVIRYPVNMRTAPTVTFSNVACASNSEKAVIAIGDVGSTLTTAFLRCDHSSGFTAGYGALLYNGNNSSGFVRFSSEL
jgi:hypothetical protein